jgi:hypothetical protein
MFIRSFEHFLMAVCYAADWDILYPFSQFLTEYKIPLVLPPSYRSPWIYTTDSVSLTQTHQECTFRITTKSDVFDAQSGSRTVTLVVDHPGLIWTTIAFDAHVLQWSLDNNPLPHLGRYHVKDASFYGTTQWELSLVLNATVRASSSGSRGDGGEYVWEKPLITVNFQGIEERGMWPAKKTDYEQAREAEEALPLSMRLFEQLDRYMHEKTQGAVDVMLLGTIAGVITL